MELLAAVRRVADQAEVYAVESEATQIAFEAGQVKSAEVKETSGVALRGLADGRLGFTAAAGTYAPEELVDALRDSLRHGDEVPMSFAAPAEGPAVPIYDPSLAEVPMARLVEVGHEIVATLREVDGEAKIDVEIERGVARSRVMTSLGADAEETESFLTIGASVERVRGDDVLLLYDSVEETSFTTSYRDMAARMAHKLDLAGRSARLRSGHMPVLFSPSGALVLLWPLMLGLNGKNVQRGASPLSDRLGEPLLDPALTLCDDPTLPGRPGSARYDDEGVPGQRKALIEEGVCARFLYDLRTAALMGTQSTGNGQRGLFSAPRPGPSNLVLAAGERSLAEMLREMGRGLLVEDVLGLGQGNAISGAFSNTVGLAFAVEDGEIVGRVKDVSIAGNVYQDLCQVAALSRERQWVYGDLYLPYVLLPELNVVCQEA